MWQPQIEYKYRVTREQYETMLKDQDDKCPICNDPLDGRIHVDHDHKTGKVRGLLCHRCNVGLGFFNDRIRFLAAAIVYLEDNGHEFY